MAEKLTDDEVMAALDSAPIRFGLAQQGHLPVVKELRAAGHSFKVIGNRIGWDAGTVAEHYCWHLEAEAASREAKLRALVAKWRADKGSINSQAFAHELESILNDKGEA